MTGAELARAVANVAWEVLQTLTTAFKPWAMADLSSRVGVPPIDLGADWTAAVEQARQDLDGLDGAEWVARVAALADLVVARFRDLLEVDSEVELLAALRPFVTVALVLALAKQVDRKIVAEAVVWVAAATLIFDVRVQESFLGASPVHRSEAGLWALIEAYATDEVKTAGTLMAAAWGVDKLVRRVLGHTSLPPSHWRWGFDVPAYEAPPPRSPPLDPPPVDPYAVAREAARWSFVVEYHDEDRSLGPGAYERFDAPAPVVPPFATGFRVAFVPVPPSSRFDRDDRSRPASVHLSLGGDYAKTWQLANGALSLAVSGDAGILVPTPRMTWDLPWRWEWSPPGSVVEVTGAVEANVLYATERRARGAPDPDGVSLTVDRFVIEAGISASGAAYPPVGAVTGRVDLEGVTLTIGRVPGLSAVLERGASVTFDLGVLARYPLGGALEFGFRGAAGAELVVPIQRMVGGPGARLGVRQVRVKARASRAADAEAGPRMALEVTGDFVLGLGGLEFAIDGAGVAVTAGGGDTADGNLVGVCGVDWSPVYPTRIGIAVHCPSFRGGGFVDYDAATERLTGGGEVVAWGKAALRVLFLGDSLLCADRRSWLVLGSVEFSSPAWFVPKGVGVLYARNRTTDPAALLAAVAAGDLSALLFPDDVAGRGSAYLTTLGRLLPASADAWVAGIFLRFAGLDGNARVDLGILYDAGAAGRAYLLARVLIGLPSLAEPLVRIEIAALGVWDRARDEYELRAALVNSRAFGGELTGEALLFSGDPDRDDGRAERVRLMSIGGFHPQYTAPGPAIRVPARVALVIERGDHLRLESQAYLAVSAGAVHAGLEANLTARFAGFGIRGHLGFDALISTSLEFAVSIRVGVALYLGSRQLLGASLQGELGVVSEDNFPTTFLRGRARISLWFFDYETPRFTLRLARGGARASRSRDPVDDLLDAILAPSNWDTGGTPGLLVRPESRAAGLWASPSAPLGFRQTVAPLGVAITHFEGAALPGPRTLDLAVVRPTDAAWTTAPVEAEFAPAMFFALTPEEKLAARGFESLPGGVELGRPLISGPAVAVTADCEDLIVDRANPPESSRPGTLEPLVAALATSLAPHLRDEQRQPPRRPPRVIRDHFAVIDRAGGTLAVGQSFAAAVGRARQGVGLEVVPTQEVV
jgi:hypothetical protein